ncbi:MAG TPA: hypothetical protein PK413_14735, partial [Thermoanaerobaculia bacterium]|nr:hypothetical protein [Thermoanaerobaculia bacterium]
AAAPARPLIASNWQAPERVRGWGPKAFVAGGVGLAASVVGFLTDREHFFTSYLLGYSFWLSLALGCLGLLMLHHMSRGTWGLPARRIWEAGARTLLPLAILFLPVLFGMSELYSWTRPEVAAEEMVAAKKFYLSVPFFLGRYVFFFLVWIFLAERLSRLSAEQDGGGQVARKMQVVAAPGLLIYALTVTFASFDWLMSLEPKWFSTIYGLWLIVGSALAAMAFTIIMARSLAQEAPMDGAFGARHFHDYGKLTFAFTILWTYITFSQFLIIWSANLPVEIPFYLTRSHNGWQYISAFLIFCQFVIPFVLLLSRDRKRHAGRLVKVAWLALLMRFVDLAWQICPNFRPSSIAPNWMDFAALVGVGGIWLGLFARNLGSRPLLPVNAPNLAESLGDE